MPAIVKCESCGRIATARVLENDHTINSFVCEPEWNDEDYEWESTVVDGETFWFQPDDTDNKLYKEPCQHEDYDVIELESYYDDYRD